MLEPLCINVQTAATALTQQLQYACKKLNCRAALQTNRTMDKANHWSLLSISEKLGYLGQSWLTCQETRLAKASLSDLFVLPPSLAPDTLVTNTQFWSRCRHLLSFYSKLPGAWNHTLLSRATVRDVNNRREKKKKRQWEQAWGKKEKQWGQRELLRWGRAARGHHQGGTPGARGVERSDRGGRQTSSEPRQCCSKERCLGAETCML